MMLHAVLEIAKLDESSNSFIGREKVGWFSRLPVLDSNEELMGAAFRHELFILRSAVDHPD